jgi:hypothetical protein
MIHASVLVNFFIIPPTFFGSKARYLLMDSVVIVIVESHKDLVEASPSSTSAILILALLFVAAVHSTCLFNAAQVPALLPNDASTFEPLNNVLVDAL